MSTGPDNWLDDEIAAVAADLASETDSRTHDDGLEITGLELLLLKWAAKFAVGFLSKVAGAAAYDRWKQARTEKQVKKLREQLSLEVDPRAAGAALADPELRHDLVEAFVEQGLTVKQAASVVDRAYHRIEQRFIQQAT